MSAVAGAFMRATVRRVVQETSACRSFDLEVSRDARRAFHARPGQFVTLRVAVDGINHERCYSLSNVDALREMPRITIKQVGEAGVSAWCNRNLSEGSIVEIAAPAGQFYVRPGDGPLLFAAGGSGITPIFAMLREVLHRTNRSIVLLYVNRSESEAIFLTALRHLRDTHASRMILIELRNDGTTPTIDAAVTESLEAQVETDVYVCGPAGFMNRVAQVAEAAGTIPDRIFSEHFVIEPQAEVACDPARVCLTRPCALADAIGLSDLRVRIGQHDGGYHELRIGIGETLLKALQQIVGPRVGVCGGQAACGTCRISIPAHWSARVPELRRHENRLLNALEGHSPEHRLACQIRLTATLDGIEFTPAPVA